MTSLMEKAFSFPDFAGQKVLILGLGGGCDIITAYALSTLLNNGCPAEIVYANTKTGNLGPVETITPHIFRVCGPVPEPGRQGRGYGRAKIDHSIPRQSNGSPWLFLLDSEVAEEELVGEVRTLVFDALVGVDTGGDSIVSKAKRSRLGRDQRMLHILQKLGLPLYHVVVAPGSDGESSRDDLQTAFTDQDAQGCYRGCFPLDPILPILRAYREALSPTRTPRIILAAADGLLATAAKDRVVVPRGCKPMVPRSWLTTGFVFTPPHLPVR